MKKLIFSITLLMAFSCNTSKTNEEIEMVQVQNEGSVQDWKSLIPADYEILEQSSSDINLDGENDIVLVLKKKNEDNATSIDDSPNRILKVILNVGNQGWFEFASNENVVWCNQCGGQMGDPFQGIKAEEGAFTVMHYGGSSQRWEDVMTFKYDKQNNDIYLDKQELITFSAFDPTNEQKTTKTTKDFGQLSIKTFKGFND